MPRIPELRAGGVALRRTRSPLGRRSWKLTAGRHTILRLPRWRSRPTKKD